MHNKHLWALSILCYDEFSEVEHMFAFRFIYMNCMIAIERFPQFPFFIAVKKPVYLPE